MTSVSLQRSILSNGCHPTPLTRANPADLIRASTPQVRINATKISAPRAAILENSRIFMMLSPLLVTFLYNKRAATWFPSQGKNFSNRVDFPLAEGGRCLYFRLTQGSGRSSGVEHNLAKVRVGRSNRLARSNFSPVSRDRYCPSGPSVMLCAFRRRIAQDSRSGNAARPNPRNCTNCEAL